ncbi:MAG TPA: hypothetical protein VNK95_11525 [Caldilineaceae bacterium]|nr:hypothetical protein [Caldilineaceae bacterium]
MPVEPRTLLAAAHHRRLATPLLLFLVGHRPLAFLVGQMLYVAAPLGALLGWEDLDGWAALLSAPDATRRLESALAGLAEGEP